MKNLIDNIKSNLSNMSEKTTEEYVDYDVFDIIDNHSMNKYWDKLGIDIMNYYIDNHKQYLTDEESRYSGKFHYTADENLSKCIGSDNIIVNYYFGYDRSYKSSNYIFYPLKDKNGIIVSKIFYIDIYGCYLSLDEEIYGAVIQELYNFKRDAEWINISINKYHLEMEKMRKEMMTYKEKKQKFFDELNNTD